jgi:glycosyltransferase A (GT-A) superfamily protein (DUF2064 family)
VRHSVVTGNRAVLVLSRIVVLIIGSARLGSFLHNVTRWWRDAQIEECHKVVLYAPPTEEARDELRGLLEGLAEDRRIDGSREIATNDEEDAVATRSHGWTLLEMQRATLQDADLSHALTAASQAIVSELFPDTASLVFVGADAPELRVADLRDALSLMEGEALLCPAQDGGYGLLGVAVSTSNSNRHMLDGLFRGVLWSQPLTALSQVRAAQLAGFGPVRLGPIMRDVDVPEDVTNLCRRLTRQSTEDASPDDASKEDSELGCLRAPSTSAPGRCRYTRQALQELGLLP